MDNVFFMVWRDGGGSPTYRHGYEAAARDEAARLARANRGQRFYVLRAVDSVVEPLPPLEWESASPSNAQAVTEQPIF